jgi:hypothetical protein
MRKIYLAVVLSLVAAVAVNAQGLGIKAGINLANFAFDPELEESLDMLFGFHAGIVYEVELTDALFFGPGLMFSQKGSKFSFNEYDDDFESEININAKTIINYLEIPLNLVYKMDLGGANLVFKAGPYLGYAINGKEKLEMDVMGTSINVSEDIEFGSGEDQMRRLDYGINAGVGLEFTGFKIGAQYGLGLSNLANDDDYKMKNRVIGVSVGYFLGR